MRAAAVAAVAAAIGAAPAGASLSVGLEDERILLDQTARAPAMTARWAALGVDHVRIHARWHDRRSLSALDAAIDAIEAAGLEVELTITGRKRRPDVARYARWAGRVATRYRGRVARYLVWNEPNQPGWLLPQRTAPHVYRALVRAAVPAIRAADPGAKVLIGELAPIGDGERTTAPLPFLRALACVDAAYRPVRRQKGQSPLSTCAGFEPVEADGFGHHPHGKRVSPKTPSADPEWAKIGDLGRLFRVLDRLTGSGRIKAPADVWLTEFGYQTGAPDFATGISLRHQAEWLQLAAYLAWRHPRVRSLTHYQFEDEPVRYRAPGALAYAGWQSGLTFVDGRAKPALRGFRFPFVVDRRRGRVWGQIRPGGAHAVTLERDGEPIGGPIRTDGAGAFLVPLALRTGDRLRARTETRATAPVTVPRSGLAAPRR